MQFILSVQWVMKYLKKKKKVGSIQTEEFDEGSILLQQKKDFHDLTRKRKTKKKTCPSHGG